MNVMQGIPEGKEIAQFLDSVTINQILKTKDPKELIEVNELKNSKWAQNQ